MSVVSLTKDTFNEEVIKCEKPVLIDFYATWCGPCRMVSPTVDEISEENENCKVCKVNVDNEPELAQQFGVVSIPMLVVVKNGKVTNQTVGVQSKKAILNMLQG